MALRFEKMTGQAIRPGKVVQVTRMNHIVQIKSVERKSTALSNLRKISKTEYVYIDTGEIGEYNLATSREESTESLAHTFKSLRELINNNFVGARNELMHTLTYSENMMDPERLMKDFQASWQRYRRRYGDVDYLAIVEPQARGAWHLHVLVRHNGKEQIFVPNTDMAKIWGHGFTTTKAIKSVDNIGAYLSAYLANVELTPETTFQAIKTRAEIITREIEGEEKRFIKGGRLHYYPPGMNLYRHSRGIVKPTTEEMTYREAQALIGVRQPDHASTVTISDGDQRLNAITYEQYNLKRE